MTARQAVRFGARSVNRSRRLIYIWWFFLLVLALFASGPMSGVIASSLSHSTYAEELVKTFDPGWAVELYQASQDAPVSAISSAVVLVILSGLLLHIFLAAGAVSVFAQENPHFTPARFFEGGGRYFWRFFRLFLLSLVFFIGVRVIWSSLDLAAQKIWGKGMVQGPIIYATRLRTVLVLLLFGFVITVFDYAKIRLVLGPSRSVLRAAGGALSFVLANLRRTMGVWLILVLFGFLFYLLYNRVAAIIPQDTVGPILLTLVIQQLYILARLWVRLTSWTAAAEIYRGSFRSAEPPAEAVAVYAWPPDAPPAHSAAVSLPLPPEEEAAGPA